MQQASHSRVVLGRQCWVWNIHNQLLKDNLTQILVKWDRQANFTCIWKANYQIILNNNIRDNSKSGLLTDVDNLIPGNCLHLVNNTFLVNHFIQPFKAFLIKTSVSTSNYVKRQVNDKQELILVLQNYSYSTTATNFNLGPTVYRWLQDAGWRLSVSTNLLTLQTSEYVFVIVAPLCKLQQKRYDERNAKALFQGEQSISFQTHWLGNSSNTEPET